MLNKTEVFTKEISWIKNHNISKFIVSAIQQLPDYFFTVAASSTGKYHPKYALGNGGLVRHTKAAVGIAHDLLSLEMFDEFSDDEKDIILASILLHDGRKHGDNGSKYTVFDHPLVVSDWIKNNESINSLLPKDQLDLLCDAIMSHMGQWNTDRSGKEIMPKPKTPIQKFVHLCDYLASRKYLEYDFGNDYYAGISTNSDELQNYISKIIDKCKKMIEDGKDRESIYDLIAKYNAGKKNPNSIVKLEIAKKIYSELTKEVLNG